ncbi:hypothetical protein QFZ97_004611 [Paraburkholderia youngii]
MDKIVSPEKDWKQRRLYKIGCQRSNRDQLGEFFSCGGRLKFVMRS